MVLPESCRRLTLDGNTESNLVVARAMDPQEPDRHIGHGSVEREYVFPQAHAGVLFPK